MSVLTKEKIKKQTIKHMKSLKVYKKEFDQIVEIYAGLVYQYNLFEQQFIDTDYQITEEYTNKAGATNQRKVPILTALESLRKDIITYSDRLQLNPKSMKQESPNSTTNITNNNQTNTNESSKSATLNEYLQHNRTI